MPSYTISLKFVFFLLLNIFLNYLNLSCFWNLNGVHEFGLLVFRLLLIRTKYLASSNWSLQRRMSYVFYWIVSNMQCCFGWKKENIHVQDGCYFSSRCSDFVHTNVHVLVTSNSHFKTKVDYYLIWFQATKRHRIRCILEKTTTSMLPNYPKYYADTLTSEPHPAAQYIFEKS